jgi:hypothetical protein
MKGILCDPYIWERPSVIVHSLSLVKNEQNCYSELVNTILSWLFIGIFVGALLNYGLNNQIPLFVSLVVVFILLAPVVYRYQNYRLPVEKFQNSLPLPESPVEEVPEIVSFPTAANPFMNVLLNEIQYNPSRPPAADVQDKKIVKSLDEFFRVQFTSDPTDIFGKTQSQRQFIVMPSTTIPNDVDSYQNWLYRIPGKTCKEGGNCLPGTDGAALPWLNSDRMMNRNELLTSSAS